ncbi:RNase P modulator RnpM [Spiroplasma diminutum]|uniref:Putative RNA-binding protein n=1 Tax=Spiroplasma diminutum CUAS-1 TaxID=1276221 RepID=S5LZL1_9MOLU|nr:YlxR family protein [Spiroplasma diminutum]AGR42031.1 putative RNA-binding protein [Spiroplasma diminutum CUAS-1]
MSKDINLRKDAASNKMYPKIELIRIVRNKNGEVFIDNTKKANGRGAYIRPTIEAVEKVKKTRVLERNLKTNLDKEFYEKLLEEVKLNWD